MRCPYCGGLNQERAAFCVSCGRDLRRPQPNVPPQRPPAQTPYSPPQQANPASRMPNQPVPPRPANVPGQAQRPAQPAQPAQTSSSTSRRSTVAADKAPTLAPFVPPPEPEAPGPFPPRTMEQFNTLLVSGAQPYTIVESSLINGKRKLVRIAFLPCAAWQQAATLLHALRDLPDESLSTVIVQGVQTQQPNVYAFTNGQLQFDRNVVLGGQTGNRYIIETGNGFASDSVRFVLNE